MISLKHTSNLFAPFLKSLQLPIAFWIMFKLFVRALKKKKVNLALTQLPSFIFSTLHYKHARPFAISRIDHVSHTIMSFYCWSICNILAHIWRFSRSELCFHSISHLTILSKEELWGEGQLVSVTWAFCGTYHWRGGDKLRLWSISRN